MKLFIDYFWAKQSIFYGDSRKLSQQNLTKLQQKRITNRLLNKF
jgi:hypothetical protein